MKNSILPCFKFYSILLISFACLLACSVDEDEVTPLSFNELEGYWITDSWQNSTLSSTLSPLTIQFTEVNRSATFRDVPNNTWGYREGDITFRALEPNLSSNYSMSGEILVKEENSTTETWMTVIITKVPGSPESIQINTVCQDCANDFLVLVRK